MLFLSVIHITVLYAVRYTHINKLLLRVSVPMHIDCTENNSM